MTWALQRAAGTWASISVQPDGCLTAIGLCGCDGKNRRAYQPSGTKYGRIICRWLAQRHTPLVRQVITVCSPFRSPLDSFFLPLRQIAPLWPGDVATFVHELSLPPPIPATYLHTITDGTVAWASCMDPDRPTDCFEFKGSHMTMPSNPAVWSLVAKRLARSLD
jgi:hypothetical protein